MIRFDQPEEKTWSSPLAISDEERKRLQQEIQRELEAEHRLREERARRKVQHLEDKQQPLDPKPQTGEFKDLKTQLQRQFYEEHGYQLKKDPTGRDMWLSPTELEFRQKRSKSKRSSKKKKSFVKTHQNNLMLYLGIMFVAVILGLLIVKRMS